MSTKKEWDPENQGPKVTIEFILPYHAEQLQDFQDASTIKSILWELQNNLRSCVKHQAPFENMEMDESKVDFAEKIRQWLFEEVQSKGVKIDGF